MRKNPPPTLFMLVYEIYAFDKKKGYELIGALPERRKNPTRMTRESVIRWGRMLLDNNVDSNDIFFKPLRIDEICLPTTSKS